MTMPRSAALPISKQHITISKKVDRLNRDMKEHQEIVDRHEQRQLQLQAQQKDRVTPLVTRTYNTLRSLQQQLKDKLSAYEKKISESSIVLKEAKARVQEKQDKIKDLTTASQGDTKATPSPKKRGHVKKLNRLTRQMSTHGLTLQTSPDEIKQLTDKSATYQSQIEQLQSKYGEFKEPTQVLQNVDENDLERCFSALALEEKTDSTNHELMTQLADESKAIREHKEILQDLQKEQTRNEGEQKALSADPLFQELVNKPEKLLTDLIQLYNTNITTYKIEANLPDSLLPEATKNAILTIERMIEKFPLNEGDKSAGPQSLMASLGLPHLSESKNTTSISSLQENCYQFYGLLTHIDQELQNKDVRFCHTVLMPLFLHVTLNNDDCRNAINEAYRLNKWVLGIDKADIDQFRHKKALNNLNEILNSFENRKDIKSFQQNAKKLAAIGPNADNNYKYLASIFELVTDLIKGKMNQDPKDNPAIIQIEAELEKKLKMQVSNFKLGSGLIALILGGLACIVGALALKFTWGLSSSLSYQLIEYGAAAAIFGASIVFSNLKYSRTSTSQAILDTQQSLNQTPVRFFQPHSIKGRESPEGSGLFTVPLKNTSS